METKKNKLTGMSIEEKRAMARRLLQEQGGQTISSPAAKSDPAVSLELSDGEIPAEFYRFDLLPGYRHLQQQSEELHRLGIMNPYFNIHEDISDNTILIGERQYINYSGYNYLGLSGDSRISQAAKAAIDQHGTSVSASRIASGEIPLHRELEQELASLVKAEDCITFVSGYGTNVSTIGHLFGPKDLLLHDALSHNCILMGCQLSGGRRMPFPHNDWRALDRLLVDNRCHHERVLIVIEGVYSMDGDIPDLPKFIEVKKRHKAFLMIDEAHSTGVLGPRGFGIGDYFGINHADVDLWMGTLSKSLASCGGYIAGGKEVIEYLRYTAPGGILYSIGMPPSSAAAALAAIRVLKAEPERVSQLRERSKLFLKLARERGFDTGLSNDSPVIPVILGDSIKSLILAERLFKRGINVQAILYPVVDETSARLRFFITYKHTEEQIGTTVDVVEEELAKLNKEKIPLSSVFTGK